MSQLKKWKTISSEDIVRYKYFGLKKEQCELPDGRIMPAYYTLDFLDWVNIVPMTKEGKIVLIRQYRHSVREITIEVPGGSIDPQVTEPSEEAALRELVEETGYTSNHLEYLGFHYPNPALLSNKMHTYIAWDCELTKPQSLDPYEEIEFFEVSKNELRDMIDQRKITHSIILGTLLLSQKKIGF